MIQNGESYTVELLSIQEDRKIEVCALSRVEA